LNIFVLDYDIKKCAEFTCDKHVVKMILESAQMLSTAVRISGIDSGYKSSYVNHPCSVWVRASLSNWLWLRELVINLNQEWKTRYNHSSNHKSYDMVMSLPCPNIKDIGLTKFAQAMPDIYRNEDVVNAYRNYYMGEKRNFVSWKNKIPEWWK